MFASNQVVTREIITGDGNGVDKKYLVAFFTRNKMTNREGFVVYKTSDLRTWSAHTEPPFINTILFETAEAAFETAEKILMT